MPIIGTGIFGFGKIKSIYYDINSEHEANLFLLSRHVDEFVRIHCH